MSTRFAIIATELGAFGLAWTAAGIARTWMHAGTVEAARREIRRALPGAEEGSPPPAVAAALDDVAAQLTGEARVIRGDLDLRAIPDFDRRVYEIARTIPSGATMTYGAIAKALGEEPLRARDVGVALARNPFAPIVPCHRVVAANGALGGYSAPGGTATKRHLLQLEGAAIVAPPPQTSLFGAAAFDQARREGAELQGRSSGRYPRRTPDC